MRISTERIVVLALAAAWAAAAAPSLLKQRAATSAGLALLGGKEWDERSRLLDDPAFGVAETIASAVPPDGCVIVSAHAGPAAIDYYNARFDYLLYPRRVQVFADSSASLGACAYWAVFRDTEPNLAAEPFQGAWDEAAWRARAAALERVAAGERAAVYRRR